MSNNTDLIYQKISLFIEGVEVPFSSISISQAIGNVPSAALELPPSPGLMDIVRYYQPKVHIFYEDPILGKDRLLFWGNIIATSYSASVSSAGITFQCVHKNNLLNQVTMDFSGYPSGSFANHNSGEAIYKPSSFGSTHSLIQALRGIERLRKEEDGPDQVISADNEKVLGADTSLLDPKFSNVSQRWVGIPSSIMNMWNQLKATAYHLKQYNSVLVAMYIPLLEDGIKFFERTSGHNLIEDAVNADRQSICDDLGNKTASSKPMMVPPVFRLHSISAIQSSLAVEAIQGMLEFSGNKTGFFRMFHEFFMSIEYEVITLASPAMVPKDPTKLATSNTPMTELMAVETVVKPQLPFYYSPICNVVLPNMYSSIRVQQDETTIPSRVTVVHSATPGQEEQVGLHYRGPHSVREAILTGLGMKDTYTNGDKKPIEATRYDLHDSTGASYNVPSKYELGRGWSPKQIMAPSWLAYLVKRCRDSLTTPGVKIEDWPADDSDEGRVLKDLHDGWAFMHARKNGVVDESKYNLDPNWKDSKVLSYQRILFAAADYDYTKEVLASKSGSIECIFNPYLIPGYPMDIMAKSPNLPNFHALCVSVTHSITHSSIGTSASFVSAATYSELSNYELMPSHPWLQTALQLYNVTRNTVTDAVESVSASVVNNPIAKAAADRFYASVLGVGAASPSDLVDFETMERLSIQRSEGSHIFTTGGPVGDLPTDNGGNDNHNLTGIGNLRLVHRPIETRELIENNFSYKFIDLDQETYSLPASRYRDDKLSPTNGDDILLEPGASLFLEYPEVTEFLRANKLKVN